MKTSFLIFQHVIILIKSIAVMPRENLIVKIIEGLHITFISMFMSQVPNSLRQFLIYLGLYIGEQILVLWDLDAPEIMMRILPFAMCSVYTFFIYSHDTQSEIERTTLNQIQRISDQLFDKHFQNEIVSS